PPGTRRSAACRRAPSSSLSRWVRRCRSCSARDRKFFSLRHSGYTEMTVTNDNNPIGCVLYDGECAFCVLRVRWLMPTLRRARFRAAPLQETWVRERLGLPAAELLQEMRVLTPEGRLLGGAGARVYLARFIWWARAVLLLAPGPGA